MASSLPCKSEKYLLREWFKNISTSLEPYKEPILGSQTVKIFKHICETLEQSTHVFVMSVELAEDFIKAKNVKGEKIHDPLLAAITTIFICHKYDGCSERLKLKDVVDTLLSLTEKLYDPQNVINMERDILVTLSGKLSITSKVDDLNILIETYVKHSKFKVSIQSLCYKLLEFLYIEKDKWFGELKLLYSQSEDCVTVFQNLVSSKFYIPVGVLIRALQLTYHLHHLNVDGIISNVCKHIKIQGDHLIILVRKITEIVE